MGISTHEAASAAPIWEEIMRASGDDLTGRVASPRSYTEKLLAAHRIRQMADPELEDPQLDAQHLDRSFIQALRSKRGSCRALFAEDSLFQDHLIYAEYVPGTLHTAGAETRPSRFRRDRHRFQLFADIPSGEMEERLIAQLTEHGAQVNDHRLTIPNYESTHTIEPGMRFELERGGASLAYIPHYSVGLYYQECCTHQASFMIDVGARARALREIDELFEQYAIRPEYMLVVRSLPPGGEASYQSLVDARNTEAKQFAEYAKLGPVASARRIYTEMKTGVTVQRVRRATADDLATEGYTIWRDGTFLTHGKHAEYLATTGNCRALLAEGGAWDVEWDSEQDTAPEDESPDPAAAHNQSNRHLMYRALGRRLDGAECQATVRDLLAKHDVLEYVYHGYRRHNKRIHQEHAAPASERGRLWVSHQRLDIGVSELIHLGLMRELSPLVPTALAYRGAVRPGRVLPWHDDYMTGSAPIPSTPGRMVVHGMTGVCDGQEAVDRLEALIKVGGLRSTAERRRMGIKVKTLSPIGDIASGIDMGVPTSIGVEPPFGDYIIFAFRPEILARRDVFFAPRDFGGGINRYVHFQQYAEHIGQDKVYHSPSPQTRERHIAEGLSDPSNEAYFKYEIPWEEVDMIILSLSPYDPQEKRRALELIDAAKASGEIPASVEVVVVGRNGVIPTIRKRAALHANERT